MKLQIISNNLQPKFKNVLYNNFLMKYGYLLNQKSYTWLKIKNNKYKKITYVKEEKQNNKYLKDNYKNLQIKLQGILLI